MISLEHLDSTDLMQRRRSPCLRRSVVDWGVLVRCRSSNPIDNMLRMLSEYTHHMEELVKQREMELHNEKKQVENMLYSILPRFTSFSRSYTVVGLRQFNNCHKYFTQWFKQEHFFNTKVKITRVFGILLLWPWPRPNDLNIRAKEFKCTLTLKMNFLNNLKLSYDRQTDRRPQNYTIIQKKSEPKCF